MARSCQSNRKREQALAQADLPKAFPSDHDAQAPDPTLHEDQTGATALETVLVMGAIGIPSYYILTICLNILTDHYGMLVTINSLPFP